MSIGIIGMVEVTRRERCKTHWIKNFSREWNSQGLKVPSDSRKVSTSWSWDKQGEVFFDPDLECQQAHEGSKSATVSPADYGSGMPAAQSQHRPILPGRQQVYSLWLTEHGISLSANGRYISYSNPLKE